jgi:ABC-type lipoprotein release transport system permease subunit
MGLINKISFRNLFRHKGRSLSIGFVLVSGAFFMTLGNGTITGLKNNLECNLVKGLVGDITLMSMEKKQDNIIGTSEQLGILEKYKKIKEEIAKKEYIERITPMILGSASILDISLGQSHSNFEQISFFGIDSENLNSVYGNSIEIVEGHSLAKGERGILINEKLREKIYSLYDVWLLPEDGSLIKENLTTDASNNIDNLITRNDLVLMGMSGSMAATDVRVPIKGIFKYTNMNEMFNGFNLVDIETSRECMGYLSKEDMVTHLSEEKKNLLKAVDEDPSGLFFENEVYEMEEPDGLKIDYTVIMKQKNTTKKANISDSCIYNFARINLKPGISLEHAVSNLNKLFMEAGVNEYVRAVSWKKAWSTYYGYAKINQTSLMVFVYIVYLAAVLMMTNALSMAAMERTYEIGTMRMVGSRKGFIARMFFMETSFLSIIFGGLGILLGIIAIKILAGMELTSTSFDLQTLFGGKKYCPHIDINGIARGIIQLGIITIIAVIYPVIVAGRVEPIDAIKRN